MVIDETAEATEMDAASLNPYFSILIPVPAFNLGTLIFVSISAFAAGTKTLLYILPSLYIIAFFTKVPISYTIKRSMVCFPFLIYALFLPVNIAVMVLLKS